MKDETEEIQELLILLKRHHALDNEEDDMILNYIYYLQEEIHKKEAMYDSLAVDYRLSQEENERYKNIIDELDKYCWELKAMGCREGALDMLDKIKELKGSDE